MYLKDCYHCQRCDVWGIGDPCWSCLRYDSLTYGKAPPDGSNPHVVIAEPQLPGIDWKRFGFEGAPCEYENP